LPIMAARPPGRVEGHLVNADIYGPAVRPLDLQIALATPEAHKNHGARRKTRSSCRERVQGYLTPPRDRRKQRLDLRG
jgi:hypothetical protein